MGAGLTWKSQHNYTCNSVAHSHQNLPVSTLVRSHTEHNSALTEVDRKKERKRNFVSAKTGFITVFELVFSYFFFGIFYGFKVTTNS